MTNNEFDTAAMLQSADPRYGLTISIAGQHRSLYRDGMRVDGDPDVEAMNEIGKFLTEERERSRSDPADPLISARAIVAAARTLDVLVRVGFPRLRPALRIMQEGCESLRRLFLRELTRRLLLDQIPEPKAAECVRLLQGLLDAGDWPTYKEDADAAQEAAFGA